MGQYWVLQDVFKGRLTAFVHNAGLYVNMTTSSAEAPKNLEPDEEWNARIYGIAHSRPHIPLVIWLPQHVPCSLTHVCELHMCLMSCMRSCTKQLYMAVIVLVLLCSLAISWSCTSRMHTS